MRRALERGASIAALMKWIGIIAALLSFGTAIYTLVSSEGELRERRRIVTEQYATGSAQQAAGDYASAWDSFALAATTSATDGLVAKWYLWHGNVTGVSSISTA